MKITCMSFNTQHCLHYKTRQIDYDLMADTVRLCHADIVGLQEIRGRGDRPGYEPQAQILAEKLGFYFYFAEAIRIGGANPYGNAILSRYPIADAQTVPIPDPLYKKYTGYYESRCLLKARLDMGLTVLVGHFGLNPDERKKAVKTAVANLEKCRCVLMGDFNTEPESRILRPIRRRMRDTAEFFSEPRYSFPSDAPTEKLDYIFVSDDLRVLSADIPAIAASDHRPHLAVIEL